MRMNRQRAFNGSSGVASKGKAHYLPPPLVYYGMKLISYRNQQHSSAQSILFTIILTLASFRATRGAFSFLPKLLSSRGSKVAMAQSHSKTTATTKRQYQMSFSDFLASPTPIHPHVVLGNEAGDADSIVSSLALGFVDSVYNSNPTTPIVSIPRADLCLRRETVLLLELAGVTQVDKLHHIDDDNNLWKTVDKITLVDHNRMTVNTNNSDIQVVEILDHHFDEGAHSNVQGDLRTIAFENDKATVASTCTLVAERLFESRAKPPYDAQLSLALLGVILLDTVNMKPEAGKGTARDQAAIDTLKVDTDWSTLSNAAADKNVIVANSDGTATIDTDNLFHILSDSKFDVDFWRSLSVTDALRLDYKRFQASNGVFGASTVLLDLDSFLSKLNASKEIQSCMKQAGIPLLAVMSSRFCDGAPRRELILCGTDEGLVNAMSQFLLTSSEASAMQATEVPLGHASDASDTTLVLRRLCQGNPKASRKQVAPIMLSFYTNAATSSSSL